MALREAAKLDGASEARIFFQIVIPMSRPILVLSLIHIFSIKKRAVPGNGIALL